MNKDKFKPVSHDANTLAQWMQDPEFKAAYDALEGEYASLAELLTLNELHSPLPQGKREPTV